MSYYAHRSYQRHLRSVKRWNEISDNLRWCHRKTDVGLTDEAYNICYAAFVIFDAKMALNSRFIEADLAPLADLGDMLLI